MTKWKSNDVPLSLTPLFFRLRLLHKGQHLRTVSSGTANRVVYGSQQTDLCNHCGTTDLDHQLLRNVPGYDGQNTMAACPTWGFSR